MAKLRRTRRSFARKAWRSGMPRKFNKKRADELAAKLFRDSPPLAETFPEGRWLYYEGDNFEAFAAEMVEKCGFDPRKGCEIQFFCPPEALEALYNSGHPFGS